MVPNRHSPVRVSHSTPFSLALWPDLQEINPPYSSQLELSPAINQRTHKVNQTPISYQSSIPTNEPSRERSSFPSGQQRHSSNNQITSRLKSQDEPPAKLQLSPRFVTTSRKYSEENRIEDHILPADVSQVTTILPNLGPKEETKTKPTNSGQERKDSRWHQKPKLKQTTIRKFVVTQPSLYDFNFLKPHKQASREDPDNWGHVMESIDPQHTVRLLLQNPNGIQPHISYSDFLFGLHISESLRVGILCMPETNLNCRPSQLKVTKQCFNKNWKHSSLQTSHGNEEFESNYKPGGTLTAVMDGWTSRVEEKGVDPYGLGRWSYIALRGKGVVKIYIVTVYRVCNNRDSGPKTAYKQQMRALQRNFQSTHQYVTPDPYKQCIIDLQGWLEHLISQGSSIILSLDSNKYISEVQPAYVPVPYKEGVHQTPRNHSGSLATLVATCGLLDPLACHHSSRPFPATYNRGKSRLDYILASTSLMPAVICCGIFPYQSIFCSDHRPCFLDFDSRTLFDDSTKEMAPPCRRQLQLQDPTIVEKYVTTLQEQLNYHKIPEKLRKLQEVIDLGQWTEQHKIEYERLDKIITDSMIHAEKTSCRKLTSTFSWSPQLVK